MTLDETEAEFDRSTVDVFNLIGYLTRADTLEAGTPCGWSFVTAFTNKGGNSMKKDTLHIKLATF